jgi:hypothetical protein
MHKFHFVSYILLSTFYFLLLTNSVHADSAGLSISPPVIEILLSPGQTTTQTFTLKAQGQNLNLIPEIHSITPQGNTGHVAIDLKPLDPGSLPLSITSPKYQLGEAIPLIGDTLVLPLTFKSAAEDITQDVYLALVFKAVSSDPGTTSSQTSPGISALILATINPAGVIPIDLDIEQFSLALFHDSWYPLTLQPLLKNNTSSMIRPQGEYSVISPTGKTVFSLPLYPNLILGHSSRNILGSHTRCEGNPHTGCVDISPLPLTWSPTWHNLGPYRLHLTITTIGGTKLTELEKIVWVLPLRLILLITSLSAIVIVIALTFFKQIFKLKQP